MSREIGDLGNRGTRTLKEGSLWAENQGEWTIRELCKIGSVTFGKLTMVKNENATEKLGI